MIKPGTAELGKGVILVIEGSELEISRMCHSYRGSHQSPFWDVRVRTKQLRVRRLKKPKRNVYDCFVWRTVANGRQEASRSRQTMRQQMSH